MYNVTLINLSPDARTAALNDGSHVELAGVSPETLQALLTTFTEIDAVENVTADPEIRIKTRHESYLIRTGQQKLFLYDVLNREAPAQVLTPAQVMAELDGSAMAARTAAPFMMPGMAALAEAEVAPLAAPRNELNLARVAAMLAAIVGLAAAIFVLRSPDRVPPRPEGFKRVDAPELADLRLALAGVYMTGALPGQHGIVFSTTGELKLFEVRALMAPGVVYASAEVGRLGGKIVLATNQPGGLITANADGTLLYCGETYRRIP